MSKQSPREIKSIVIPFEVFRRSWFETGGTDIFGDATDEELDTTERAQSDSERSAEPQVLEDAGIRLEDIDNLLA